MGRHERGARRSLARKLLRKLRPLLRAPELLLPLLVDVPVFGVALQLGEQRARRADLGVIRMLLESVDQLGEDTDAGVLLWHAGMAPRSRDVELQRDGALLGDRKEGESLVVDVLDASEALVENKSDAVLAVARFDRFSQRFRRTPTVDFLVKAGRENDVAASEDALSVSARQNMGEGAASSPFRLEALFDKLVESSQDADQGILAVGGAALQVAKALACRH